MLSPAVYLRCSLNSTEKPWKGLACRPAKKPSTMNLARRSSRATWRMTFGLRYFPGLLMMAPPDGENADDTDGADQHGSGSVLIRPIRVIRVLPIRWSHHEQPREVPQAERHPPGGPARPARQVHRRGLFGRPARQPLPRLLRRVQRAPQV